MEDITLSLSALLAFATVVGGYATLRANSKRSTERHDARDVSDAQIEARITRLESWKTFLAGRDGADDPTKTKEWSR